MTKCVTPRPYTHSLLGILCFVLQTYMHTLFRITGHWLLKTNSYLVMEPLKIVTLFLDCLLLISFISITHFDYKFYITISEALYYLIG